MAGNNTKRRQVGITKLDGIQMDQRKEKYRKSKEKDLDTIERKEIYAEIKRLIGYGLPEKEVVERLTEKFSTSKYQMFFQSWVKDQYKKRKLTDNSKEDKLQR